MNAIHNWRILKKKSLSGQHVPFIKVNSKVNMEEEKDMFVTKKIG